MTRSEKVARLQRERSKLEAVRRSGFTDRVYKGRVLATAAEQEHCVDTLLCDLWRQLRRMGVED